MIITFNTLREDFIKRSSNKQKIDVYRSKELNHIEKFINHKDFGTRGRSTIGIAKSSFVPQTKNIKQIFLNVKLGWSIFENAYDDYLINESEYSFKPSERIIDKSEEENDRINKFSEDTHNQGLEFAKYVLWLQKQKGTNRITEKKKIEISRNEQILILHYMGFNFLNFQNKSQLSEILCLIIDKNKKNVSDSLTNFDTEVKTKNNLTAILKRFQHKDFSDIRKQIEQDLEKTK